MKTTVFALSNMRYEHAEDPLGEPQGTYRIPILPAYAVLHTGVEVHKGLFGDTPDAVFHTIENDQVRVTPISMSASLGSDMPASLTVSYSGIRNYSLLFPHIENEKLKIRLGQFAEEAERAFDASVWMSFVLMAGAVIEGLLMNRFGNNKKFIQLIKMAGDSSIVAGAELESLNEVREARNRVHADKFEFPFVGRQLAMDVYVIYDRLLKRRWDLDV